MKVVYIPDRFEYYGATESFLGMIREITELYDITPVILTSKRGRINKFADEKGYENYVIGHRSFLLSAGSTGLRKIIKLLLLPYYYIEYRVTNAVAIRRAEKYVDFSTVDIIHTNVNRNNVGAILAERHNIKHIWHLREFVGKDYECIPLIRNYAGYMNRGNNYFIAISDMVMRCWIERGISSDRIVRIYNGIDDSKFIYHRPDPIEGKIRIVMVGALNPTKGQEYLIKALGRIKPQILPGINVDLYGEGSYEYKYKLRNLVRRLQLEGVVNFRGYHSDISAVLGNYDVGIMASRAEAFGRTTAEYMMSGVLVLASNTGVNPEIIEDGRTGLLFDLSDPSSLARIIERLVADREIIGDMAERAREYAVERFRMEDNARNVYARYNSVLGKRTTAKMNGVT